MSAAVRSKAEEELLQRIALVSASNLFDAAWYRSEYPDVALVGIDPAEHYVRIGSLIGRNPSQRFDAAWYVRQNPSVAEANLEPLYHYLRWGRAHGQKIRRVGAKHPVYEHVTARRAVSLRLATWDAEREIHFLSAIEGINSVCPTRFDRLRVSVVMPTFNRAHSIAHAIESVLAQTHRNLHLLIADDGSTDATASVVGAYRSDPRVRYLPGLRSGVSAARNRGLRAASGEYVFYLDSDNAWRPDFLRTMLVFMEHGGLAAAYSASECIVDVGRERYFRGDDFDWFACLKQNYVDMNCFGHRISLVGSHGEFDESLRRLVDWDLILRYTRAERTAFAPFVGVQYDDTSQSDRITHSECRKTQELLQLFDRIRSKHAGKVAGAAELELRPLAEDLVASTAVQFATAAHGGSADLNVRRRIGYVLWDWPALSQTFVLNEIRQLLAIGHDVKVYYKVQADVAAGIDFEVDAHQVEDSAKLETLLAAHAREVLHSPFAYPSTTLLMWPAAEQLGLPFTFMAGGVDVTHYENMRRNRIAEVASSPNCRGVITLGSFHRDLLIGQGVPSWRILMERQAVDLPPFRPSAKVRARPLVLSIGRFVEKKGFSDLVQAAKRCPDVDFLIHGYGPLEPQLRSLVQTLRLSNVEFGGPLSSAELLHAAYAKADLFVLPCVRAENGDLDGLPTVLLEAMAAGIPVVSTRIANIPDLVSNGSTGTLCTPGDVDSLVAGIKANIAMTPPARAAIIEAARQRVLRYAGRARTAEALLDLWSRRSMDIVMVTYDTDRYPNIEDTVEIIERLYRVTAMPFELFVVDNGSRPEFLRAMQERFGWRENLHLVELEENIFCGPASNIGFRIGKSEYIVYVCSKEGFVLRHGWDRQLVRAMDANPAAGMGGHLATLPRFRRLGDLRGYPSFARWRSQDLADRSPEAPFQHVQGGFFVLRRSTFEASGGFNPDTPHDGMDVEFSYHLRALGFELTEIPGLAAVTVKTLPPMLTLVDEFSFAVHPSCAREVALLDDMVAKRTRYCALCTWKGEAFDGEAVDRPGQCPVCGSSAFSRTALRILSHSGVLQTRPRVSGLLREPSLDRAITTLCPRRRLTVVDDSVERSRELLELTAQCSAGEVLLFDRFDWADVDRVRQAIAGCARAGATVLIADPGSALPGGAKVLDSLLEDSTLHASRHALVSEVCRYDILGVYFVAPVELPGPVQALDL